ncbi:MAG: thiolase domain-containing protein [Chloroflexi bacterium]|nr:MAG: thiolase domain-containing protein [Chloroflexota bacterium]HDN80711.1 thiolase domain-containing protein [Chloroflexota bacterium]
MREVAIIGIGQTKVGEHWEKSLRQLAAEAILAAIKDAKIERVDLLYVGNMLSGEVADQEHLGAAVADFAGLRTVEAYKIEAACASGAAALRQGYIAVAGGLADFVVVCGVEKVTDAPNPDVLAALALATDGEYERAHGLSLIALNAIIMRRYMHEYGYKQADFAAFSVNAHRNAVNNPYAMFRRPITEEAFAKARMVVEPINLLDSAPVADGAAALVLCPLVMAKDFTSKPVRIAASAAATDALALHDRKDLLFLEAACLSAKKAYELAGIGPQDVDFFELTDASTVMAALSLEAAGFAERGEGVRLAMEGEITLEGRIPISTMGGLKARGHPIGATGIYQAVEAVIQLRHEAGENQVRDAHWGLIQNIGGTGGTAITHILEGPD